jgi:hypothetical protein
MPPTRFVVKARVSTENPAAIRSILTEVIPGGSVTPTSDPREFLVEGVMEGPSARDLNRAVLTALRRAEKRTRLRAEWTSEGTVERFFDYVPKGKRTSA